MSRGRRPSAAQVRERVRQPAKQRKMDDGTTVLRVFRNLFERARDERGLPPVEAGKIAGLGTAVFMGIAALELEREPSTEVWDAALRMCVEVMAKQLTPERLLAALEAAPSLVAEQAAAAAAQGEPDA